MKLRRIHLGAVAAALIFCGAVSPSRLAAVACAAGKSTSHFVRCADDDRVLFEPGAERLAGRVCEALPPAVHSVETQQYGRFAAPVAVYVCASLDSFESYCPGRRSAAGCVINKRLFLSPKLDGTPARVPRIVAHELSHLHLQQRVGPIRLHLALPPWFQEGLAVYVSGGGGAELVSDDQARQSIAAGKCFVPENSGSLVYDREAPAYGLTHHMFYRQSALFIEYLKTVDEQKFEAFLLRVEDGHSLGRALTRAYGRTVDSFWRDFVAGVKEMEAHRSGQQSAN